mmetsp:Transcript_4213/g.8442  ORF Transcript_4213/g.8442 Transcript_4213/m.8442 type:complete len:414 (+) Transcript_4213:136-1377(+)
MEFIEDGDEFFEQLWDYIDNSQTCCWILTYHMVDNFIANETLRRLIAAADRGVSVVLYVDYLNYWLNPSLASELIAKGAIIKSLNPMNPYDRFQARLAIFGRDAFERYHQKLTLIDSTVIVGSANLDCDYAGPKHGNSKFYDLNVVLKRKCVREAQEVFKNIADRYGWELKVPLLPEDSSSFYEIIVSEPQYLRWDIQEKILQMLDSAQHRIVILQGYYFVIPKIMEAIERAVKRGVEVEMITSKDRDQPAYKNLSNPRLTKSMSDLGVKVYEYPRQLLHMKAYIADNSFTVGSFNNDKWSWCLNNELNILNTNPEETQRFLERLEAVKKQSSIVLPPEPLGWKKSMLYEFWSWFLINSEHLMNRRPWLKLHFPEAYISRPQEQLRDKFRRKIDEFRRKTALDFGFLLFDAIL